MISTVDLLEEIITTYITSLVISKAVKAFGEKDCAEIIQGTGFVIVAADTILLVRAPLKTLIDSWRKIKSLGNPIEESKLVQFLIFVAKKYKETVGD